MKRIFNTFSLLLIAALAVKCASLTTLEFSVNDKRVFHVGAADDEEPVHDQVTGNLSSDFDLVTVPFYYDHTNAPKSLTEETVLNAISLASKSWEQACSVSFKYMGSRHGDYVDVSQKYSNEEGIIYWGKLSEDAIGEAQMGSTNGPAFGFVLGLEPKFFSKKHAQTYLSATVMHELGHVIGLSHSNDPKSIMYAEQRDFQLKLNQGDIAMCKYFRARWDGASKDDAAKQYGVIAVEE